jgi:hypothetical protein
LDSIEKEEVYEIYLADPIVEDAGTTRYSYSQFTTLWKKAFPKVKIRKFKNVAGKCDNCEQFKYLMKHLKKRSSRRIIRQYRLLHRNYYMGEKLMYYLRRQEAKNSNNEILSLIIDKQSTYHTVVPYGGDAKDFPDPFALSNYGVINHTNGETRFYVTYPTVASGNSIVLHCILCEIERFIKNNNGRKPKKIYVQLDGIDITIYNIYLKYLFIIKGALDNTANATIGMFEHIVLQGICPEIYVYRLPVGHTHEDIDSR